MGKGSRYWRRRSLQPRQGGRAAPQLREAFFSTSSCTSSWSTMTAAPIPIGGRRASCGTHGRGSQRGARDLELIRSLWGKQKQSDQCVVLPVFQGDVC